MSQLRLEWITPDDFFADLARQARDQRRDNKLLGRLAKYMVCNEDREESYGRRLRLIRELQSLQILDYQAPFIVEDTKDTSGEGLRNAVPINGHGSSLRFRKIDHAEAYQDHLVKMTGEQNRYQVRALENRY